jgi:predicted ATPase/class 3 adenylate cyclase
LRDLPTGTVTFLFTDIEGSTDLLHRMGDDTRAAFDSHDRILTEAIADQRGILLRTEGDAVFAVFESPLDAVLAATAAQRALGAHEWQDGGEVRVRMGIHTGEGVLRGADYHGIDVHRAARISAAGHGGQILVSASTVTLAAADPNAPRFVDLGAHRFKDLLEPEHIYQVAADDLPGEFPPIRSLATTKNNLPTQLTSFVPRADLERIVALVEEHRLVTLTGPGGTGKTRLALQSAAAMSDAFDEIYFIPLAPVTDPELVAATIASTLGLTHASGAPETLIVDYLDERRALLVLDNFEQVLDAAPLMTRLLSDTSRVKILTTSRAPLHVAGEREYAVPPLAVPNGTADLDALKSVESVALFIDRATAALPDFDLDDDNAPAVAEITRRLDGLPLAIELAAARVKLLPPPAMARRLGTSLDLLSSTRRDLPERQQTLRGTISWSYDLLDPGEQRLLAALSVFRGGATLEAIEMVCTHVADSDAIDLLATLETLVDHSLVRQFQASGTPRFGMLETIREFAWERLRDSDDCPIVQDAHLTAYLRIAEEAAPHLTGSEQATWLAVLNDERDNTRAAIAFALDAERVNEAGRLTAALWRYWHMRGLIPEGIDVATRVLALSDPPLELRFKVLQAAGGLAYWAADFDRAAARYDEALDVARALGDPSIIAEALYDASFPAMLQRTEGDRVRAMLEEAERLFSEAGDRLGAARIGWARGVAGIMVFDDPSITLDESLAALPVFEAEDDVFMVGWAHHMAAVALMNLERLDEAVPHTIAALDVFEPAGDVSGVILQIQNINQLCLRIGDYEVGVVLAGAIATQQHRTGMNLAEAAANAVIGLDPAYEALGKDRVDELFEQGMQRTLEEAVALAREVAAR